MESDTGRVHFPEDQLAQHDSEIVIRSEGEDTLGIHLGFLQYKHSYEIHFSIKDSLDEDVDVEHSLHARILDVMPSEDAEGHDLTIDLSAQKEKLMHEKLKLTSSKCKSRYVILHLHARVLGKGKGTPALRNGIRCTGIDMDYDSEQSDWQGFD